MLKIYLQNSKPQPNSTQANKFTAQGNKSVALWNKFAAQGNKNAAQGNFWSKPELPTEEEKVFFRGDCLGD